MPFPSRTARAAQGRRQRRRARGRGAGRRCADAGVQRGHRRAHDGRGRATVGRAAVSLAGGRSRLVRVTRSKGGRTALLKVKKGKAVRVRARIVVKDAAGNVGTATVRLSLER
jgi:hypothetical protein